MGDNFGKIFGIGLAAVAVIVALVFFAKRGDHLQPQVTVLKERTIALNDETALLVLDVRILNDSDVTMTVDKIDVGIEKAAGGAEDGMLLRKADLLGEFTYFPLLGEKFNETLSPGDPIAPRSKTDRMIGATFQIPIADLDGRKAVSVTVQDASGVKAVYSGK